MNFLINLIFIQSQIVEEPTFIGFTSLADLQTKVSKRIHKNNDAIELRSAADGGSLITFAQPNPADEWSFEFTINKINLKFPEKAGIYLWYTDNHLEDGLFNGSMGNFTGMMAGLEFLGHNVSIVLTSNDGSYDFEELEDYDVSVMRDSINPERFRNVDEITFKLIATKKNFKIELYSGSKLLYDSLRYITYEDLGDLGKNKHFSITTTYEKVPLHKHFILKSAKSYSRKEDDTYDPYKINAPEPNDEPRFFTHVDHPNKEVQHMISSLEHLTKYLKSFIGKPSGIQIFKGLHDVHYEIERLGIRLEEIIKEINDKNSKPSDNVKTMEDKFIGLERKMRYLQDSLAEIETFMKNFDNKHSTRSIFLIGFMGIAIFVILLVCMLKYYIQKEKTIAKYS